MFEYLSPSFTHDKLENASFSDLVDVFEDLWRKCVLNQCELLLKNRDGQIAAMSLLCSYFEAIWIHISGEDSNGKSREFFTHGFCRVFRSSDAEVRKAAEAVYAHVRCGLAHEGFMRRKVSYGDAGTHPFVVTYHKKSDGTLDLERGAVSIALNPFRVLEGVRRHFDAYVAELRKQEDADLCSAFKRSVERLWAPGGSENIIGMTEAEFTGNA